MSVHLDVVADLQDLTARAGELVVSLAKRAIARHGAFWVALSGGHTPEPLYRALAADERMPWDRTVLCLGDDRRVPETHADSNTGMVRRLLVQRLAHPPPLLAPDGADADGPRAAASYEAELRRTFGGQPVDLSLQGLGDDGHTASIFPGSPALDERTAWVQAVPAPTTVPPPLPRITMTPAYLVRAHSILLVVAGSSKAEAVARLMAPTGDERACPSRLIHRCEGAVMVMCDRAAAAKLPPRA
ncbi:MAG TPA: 6-phosphogluconolactonase [Myxococcales bacterium]|nr:6-phosphogluconolactonase [Myxococcales bacterium]